MTVGPDDRALSAHLDALIPPRPDGTMPQAGDAEVIAFLRRAVGEKAGPAARIVVMLNVAAPTDAVAMLARLEISDPEGFTAFQRLAYMAHYSRPGVRRALGLSDQPTQPQGYSVPAEDPDMIAALVAPVMARGRAYRP
jgi:hypothetical protein